VAGALSWLAMPRTLWGICANVIPATPTFSCLPTMPPALAAMQPPACLLCQAGVMLVHQLPGCVPGCGVLQFLPSKLSVPAYPHLVQRSHQLVCCVRLAQRGITRVSCQNLWLAAQFLHQHRQGPICCCLHMATTTHADVEACERL
jgi:hypothetical protein